LSHNVTLATTEISISAAQPARQTRDAKSCLGSRRSEFE
jgi:hypothetical protein